MRRLTEVNLCGCRLPLLGPKALVVQLVGLSHSLALVVQVVAHLRWQNMRRGQSLSVPVYADKRQQEVQFSLKG